MPELVEVETYRVLAERLVGRTISAVEAPDDWYLKGSTTISSLRAATVGHVVAAVRRIGKLLLIDIAGDGPPADGVTDGATLGLHFGMTGRLMVDGDASIDRLLYSTAKPDPAYERFALLFTDDGRMVMVDPRRLGSVELDPDEDRLGPDAATITVAPLRDAIGGSTVALKARLLDQRRIAGVGNLIADEVLWRAGLDPGRQAGSLDDREVRRLQRTLRRTISVLADRGGSHTGDLMEERQPGGHCPSDGAELQRTTVGGRTTWWCPAHQV